MEAADTIRRINKDFARLLREEIRDDPRFTWEAHEGATILSYLNDRRLILPGVFNHKTPFEYSLWQIVRNIKQFWAVHRSEYIEALSCLDGLLIYVPLSKHALPLATFFDTVLLPNPVISLPEETKDWCTIVDVHRAIAEMHSFASLMAADTDLPLGALAMIPPDGPIQASTFPQFIQSTMKDVHVLAAHALNSASLLPGVKPPTVEEWQEIANMKTVNLETLFHINKFLALIDEPVRQTFIVSDSTDSGMTSLKTLFQGRTAIVEGWVFDELLKMVLGALADHLFAAKLADWFHADQAVIDPVYYRRVIEMESKETVKRLGISEELAVALTLETPEFSWIRAMSLEDIVRFRENGGCEMLRGVFREERKRIKYASLEDLNGVVTACQRRLDDAIREHEKALDDEQAKLRKKMRSTILGFGGTLALSVISVAAPPVAAVSLPLAIWSAAIGGNSAKDIIAQRLTGKRHIDKLRLRPIGILSKYRYQKESKQT